MRNLGQNGAFGSCVTANRAFKIKNYTHENASSGHIFFSTNAKFESIPKPPYRSEIVTYEDDQTAILKINFAKIHFPVSKILLAFNFTSNCHDGVMITSPQQASS
jgi:hypothetical protein